MTVSSKVKSALELAGLGIVRQREGVQAFIASGARVLVATALSSMAILAGSASCSSDAATESANPNGTDSGSDRVDSATSLRDGSNGLVDGAAPDVVAAIRDGVLIGGPGPLPGAIAGIDWRSGGEAGTTDKAGRFRYREGAAITFSIAGVELATVPAKPKLSPFALAGGPCKISEPLRRVLVTLETLDDDAKPETGISLPAFTAPPGESRKLTTLSEGDFAAWLVGLSPGRTAANASAAVSRFVVQVEDEAWTKTSETAFDTVASASRSQGVAWDGAGYLFSWTLGLQRTDANLATTVNKTAAIPLDLLLAGSNHIGDIDVHAGTLYAPIEDGNKYEKPRIVLFDAATLDPKGTRFDLPTSLLTKGVPWIAVDGAAASAYVAEWDPTPSIFVFDLATFNHQRTIALSSVLGRIQGAKVLEGSLYAAADDAEKTVYKIHLETGIVFPALFNYTAAVVKELEGIVAIPGNGSSPARLQVLGVDASGNSVTFRTHSRSRAPLRAELCSP